MASNLKASLLLLYHLFDAIKLTIHNKNILTFELNSNFLFILKSQLFKVISSNDKWNHKPREYTNIALNY